MTTTTKPDELNDLELILLSSALRRSEGMIHPLPKAAASDSARIDEALGQLFERGLVAKAAVTQLRHCWYEQEGERVGLVITDAGRTAINGDAGGGGNGDVESGDVARTPRGESSSATPPTSGAATARGKPGGKTLMLLDLLRRETGASLGELVVATGWLPHSTRAALTGLRKKGHAIGKNKIDGITRYSVAAAITQ